MIEITNELKEKVIAELLRQRANYTGSDSAFSNMYDINKSVFSSLKNGGRERLLSDAKWLNLARRLEIPVAEKVWKAARTDVFTRIEEEVLFCKEYSKSMIFVDDCGIGKTFTAKYLTKKLENCFYIDASQCKTARLFIRSLAKAIGVNAGNKLDEVRADIKYCLRYLVKPIVFIDEPGDVKHETWLVIKEFWNATDGCCAWYLMGAEGLREVLDRGIRNKKVGYAEMFSRMSERYSSVVPYNKQEKVDFYRKLIRDILTVNMADQQQVEAIVQRSIVIDQETGHIGGLRRIESLVILNS